MALRRLRSSALLPLCVLIAACDGLGSGAGRECDEDDECGASEECVARTCVFICRGVELGDGSDGALCMIDADCNSRTCDNGTRLSDCRCEPCAPFSENVGGTPENPRIFEQNFSCVDENFDCFGNGVEDNARITFSLVQNGKDIVGTVVEDGSTFRGELCDRTFVCGDRTPVGVERHIVALFQATCRVATAGGSWRIATRVRVAP